MSTKLKIAVAKTASKIMKSATGSAPPRAEGREFNRSPTYPTLMHMASVKRIGEKERREQQYESLDAVGEGQQRPAAEPVRLLALGCWGARAGLQEARLGLWNPVQMSFLSRWRRVDRC